MSNKIYNKIARGLTEARDLMRDPEVRDFLRAGKAGVLEKNGARITRLEDDYPYDPDAPINNPDEWSNPFAPKR